MKIEKYLASESETLEYANFFAERVLTNKSTNGFVSHLIGDLGAGKTCFVRGILRSLGHSGAVKSPTYTILESYQIGDVDYYHFDLYRIADPEELDYLGVRDMESDNAVFFIEWPQNGVDYVLKADIEINITHKENGRNFEISSKSDRGLGIVNQLSE